MIFYILREREQNWKSETVLPSHEQWRAHGWICPRTNTTGSWATCRSPLFVRASEKMTQTALLVTECPSTKVIVLCWLSVEDMKTDLVGNRFRRTGFATAVICGYLENGMVFFGAVFFVRKVYIIRVYQCIMNRGAPYGSLPITGSKYGPLP